MFTGWIRRDETQRCHAVARGYSAESVFGRLLTMMEGGELPSDLDPNETPGRFRAASKP
jgi:hypothetical protein